MIDVADVKKVSIVGAGAWGTSIAMLIADAHPEVKISMWAYEKHVAASINKNSENSEFLPGKKLQETISATNSLREAVYGAEIIILATPSKVVPDICLKLKKKITGDIVLGFLTKGFCKIGTETVTISSAIEHYLPDFKDKTVAVYGPSHAEEVSNRFHTCMSIASRSKDARDLMIRLLTSYYMECRGTDDIIGVELGGTLKNPAAIAAGIISVLPGCGDNLSGALIAESLKEMLSLAEVFNARPETIIDISGLGDLVATSLSPHSRNRRFGIDIAKQIIKEGGTLSIYDKFLLRIRPRKVFERMSRNLQYLAEGAYAIEPLIEFSEKHNISIPVYHSLYEVLLNKKDPSLLIETIKKPDKFNEARRSTGIIIKERKRGLEKVNSSVFRDIIIDRTVNAIQKQQEAGGKTGIIESLNKNPYPVSEKESQLIEKFRSNENNSEALKGLALLYADEIIDHYKPAVSYIYRNYISVYDRLKGIFGGKKLTVNYIERGSGTKEFENIIYLPYNCNEDESILFTSMIKKLGYTFPRFHVENDGSMGIFKKKILRSAGAYILQKYKLENDIYRQTFFSYIITMLEHGIPVMYRAYPVRNREYAVQFFENVLKMMYEHTVEVKILPIKLDSYNTLISDPIALSEYTKSNMDSRDISAELISRILAETD